MRLRLLAGLLALPLALAAPAAAQAPADEPNAALFAPLDLPAPNAYRAADGRPGPDYWQNEADYRIEIALDTVAHRLSGTVTLTYTNHSPHALDALWLHLEQNLFAPGSRGAALLPPASRWRGAFDEGGYRLGEVTVAQAGRRYPPTTWVDDTRLRVGLREPLAPNGGTVEVRIPYSFVMPEYGADRMGRFEAARGTVYEFAQWFPRVAVFDDVNGWNALPYLGQGEFYLDYGDFDVEITVPASLLVVATGAVQNEGEVYTAEQRRRLEQARTSDARVYVVNPAEAGRPAARPAASGTTTWRFRAENVRDFAWAASSAFMLDAASVDNGAGERVLVMSAYPHEGLGDEASPGWEHATEYNAHSIGHYGRVWYPYPYPVAISVAGVVGGMEYPMIQFSSVESRGFGLFAVIDHELGHNWYPMIVGSDERRHAWMDEGFNTFINVHANLAYFDSTRTPAFGAGEGRRAPYVQATSAASMAGMMQAVDQPIMTYPDRTRGSSLGVTAYFKPAAGLALLREHVLGPDRFDTAFREYTRRWAFKHPQPADFFRTMESVAGEDLAWFWRGWLYTTDTYDAAVTQVTPGADGTVVEVANRGGLAFPITAEVTYEGGATERVRVPVEAFFLRDTASFGVSGGRVTRVRLDPDGLLPDTDRASDTWTAGDR